MRYKENQQHLSICLSMKNFSLFFILLLVAHLFAITFRLDFPFLEWITKPALLISLGIFFYFESKKGKILLRNEIPILSGRGSQRALILAAIIFSCLGDTILLFENMFVFGLGSFLIAHVCYISAFIQDNQGWIFTKKDRWFWVIPVAVYGIAFMSYLLPHLGAMTVPVCVYSIAILTMFLTVINRWKSVGYNSFWWVLIGAVFFCLSDSLLAINLFAQPIPMGNILVITTYAVGQFMMILGSLKNKH
jgi:uncharacterized membrane protein YhhN